MIEIKNHPHCGWKTEVYIEVYLKNDKIGYKVLEKKLSLRAREKRAIAKHSLGESNLSCESNNK